jgi:pSer/pThr/pTyr-binding forkhead associated (FHA) protein
MDSGYPMYDDFEQTVQLNSSKTFMPTPVTRRDILSQIKGPGAPQTIIILDGTSVIGRSPEADIQFQSSRVSRMHAKLVYDGTEYSCTDLDSHNGLLLNGIHVHSAALRDGDTIQIGDVVLIYHQGVQWASM